MQSSHKYTLDITDKNHIFYDYLIGVINVFRIDYNLLLLVSSDMI